MTADRFELFVTLGAVPCLVFSVLISPPILGRLMAEDGTIDDLFASFIMQGRQVYYITRLDPAHPDSTIRVNEDANRFAGKGPRGELQVQLPIVSSASYAWTPSRAE